MEASNTLNDRSLEEAAKAFNADVQIPIDDLVVKRRTLHVVRTLAGKSRTHKQWCKLAKLVRTLKLDMLAIIVRRGNLWPSTKSKNVARVSKT